VLDRLFPKPVNFISDYTFGQYLCRVAELNEFSDEALVLSLTYLHRIYDFQTLLSQDNKQHQNNMDRWWQLHQFALSGLRLASKYLEDICVSNQTFAYSVGCPVKMLNQWEREFFQFMNYDIQVERRDYFMFLQFLQTMVVPILEQKLVSASVTESKEINNSIALAWFSKLSKPDRLSISHHWLLFDAHRNPSGPVFLHLSKEEILKQASDHATLVWVERPF